MKKIYTLAGAALISVASFAQLAISGASVHGIAQPLVRPATAMGERAISDTTGIGGNVIATSMYLPVFAPTGQVVTYYTGASVTSGGYVYGNNMYGDNICAQGYQNLSSTSAKVEGVIVWFTKKRSASGSSAGSKVVIKAWAMAPNKATNTDGAGGSAVNSPGPATGPTAPVASANLLFSAIDTTFLADNYVAFATPPTFSADFAVGVDASVTNLTAGDTVGIFADDASANDAANLDYALTYYGTKWYACDYLWSGTAGTGLADADIAIFAVFSNVTGVNEYFNGMKLTNYPNPAIDNTVVDYTLEKDSKNVSIVVRNQSGAKVIENKFNDQTAGNYKVNIETSKLAPGTYFYQLTANGRNFTKKLVVIK